MSVTDLVRLSYHGSVALIETAAPPVNALSLPVRQGLDKQLRAAQADAAISVIVIICSGRTFFAGADIKELGAPPVSPRISELNQLIEDSPKPVVAAIHGTALGGGLELAMSCHYRIAVESARCGLTEVSLGILPGAGGTQRLPRLVGVEKALNMITGGVKESAADCVAMGLIDRLAQEQGLAADAIAFAEEIVDQGYPLRRVRDRDQALAEVRGDSVIFEAFKVKNAKKFRGFNAPYGCIRCIEAAVKLPFEQGLAFEKTVLNELNAAGQAAALQYAFFAERSVKKIPGINTAIEARAIATVGVVGAGTMGGGIAMNFANIGLPVTLVETQQAALDRGLATIRNNYMRSVKRGSLSLAQLEQRMALFSGSLDYRSLADADLVIEAVFEDMAVKRSVFERLDRVVKADAILATNTSFLDIDQIAAATRQPERVLGLHFFSPANVMKLVEVVRTPATADKVLVSVLALTAALGKIAVVVGNCDGFVGNRIVVQRKNQGLMLIQEGALPWQVDHVLTDLGFPMGPFAMSDLAGLDIGWDSAISNAETIRDRLCERGRRGQKTAAGYYDYDTNGQPSASPVVADLIAEFMADKGLSARAIEADEILQRCLYPMINEACKILDQGIAIRASDIDVIMINGYGFPRYLGGLCYYADQLGLDKVLAVMQDLAQRLGESMQPAPLLERLVAEGGALASYSNT